MKFGKYLQDNIKEEWRFYYIDYERLKRSLKRREEEPFSEQDEAEFVQNLEKEMQKVFKLNLLLNNSIFPC